MVAFPLILSSSAFPQGNVLPEEALHLPPPTHPPRPVCVCGHITGVGQFAPPTEADPSVPHQSTAQQPSFELFFISGAGL